MILRWQVQIWQGIASSRDQQTTGLDTEPADSMDSMDLPHASGDRGSWGRRAWIGLSQPTTSTSQVFIGSSALGCRKSRRTTSFSLKEGTGKHAKKTFSCTSWQLHLPLQWCLQWGSGAGGRRRWVGIPEWWGGWNIVCPSWLNCTKSLAERWRSSIVSRSYTSSELTLEITSDTKIAHKQRWQPQTAGHTHQCHHQHEVIKLVYMSRLFVTANCL